MLGNKIKAHNTSNLSGPLFSYLFSFVPSPLFGTLFGIRMDVRWNRKRNEVLCSSTVDCEVLRSQLESVALVIILTFTDDDAHSLASVGAFVFCYVI